MTVDSNESSVVYTTEIGGEAYKKDGKFYFRVLPVNREAGPNNEVPPGVSVWPANQQAKHDGQKDS